MTVAMGRLEHLVKLLILTVQPPADFTVSPAGDFVKVRWEWSGNVVTLTGCEHRLIIEVTKDDGGPCPASRMFSYTHTRLSMALQWAHRSDPMKFMDDIIKGGMFHQVFDTDPIIVKSMTNGELNNEIWRMAATYR